MSLPLSLYRRLSPLVTRAQHSANAVDSTPNRPDEPLIWLHGMDERNASAIAEIVDEITERVPEIWFLLTGDEPVEDIADNCIVSAVPPDTLADTSEFLDKWVPDAAIWLSGDLRPELLVGSDARGIPIFLLDTGNAIDTAKSYRMWPGLRSELLPLFQRLLVADDATSNALIRAGAPADNVEVSGVLERGGTTLGYSVAERDTLAQLLNTRPVWLAAGINYSELDAILAAHRQALRRAHRLLLIIVPDLATDGDSFAAVLRGSEMNFAHRSLEEEPDSQTQVYLADTDGELGLWYCLAPVSFMGQTLVNRFGTGPNPFDAAALGSVVLHGPGLEPHEKAFDRLDRAGAARQISHSSELAMALDGLLSPDRAAEMAAAAWEVTTAGAEVIERIMSLVFAEIDMEDPSE